LLTTIVAQNSIGRIVAGDTIIVDIGSETEPGQLIACSNGYISYCSNQLGAIGKVIRICADPPKSNYRLPLQIDHILITDT